MAKCSLPRSPALPIASLRAIVSLGLALSSGCNSDAFDAAGSLPSSVKAVVEAARVEPEPFSEHVEIVGQLAAAESVVVRSEIAGVVLSASFEEGNDAQKGDVLFVLDAQEQEAELRLAEANLVLAADVYERTKKLSKVKISAASELTQARAGVNAAQATVDLARVALARTLIRAPFDGSLGARQVSPGDRIDSDDPLVQIDAVDRLQLQFSLPERAIALARKGLVVTARVSAYEEESFEARVYFVSPTLDPSSRRLALKAWVPNGERRLRPGMFARVMLDIEGRQDTLLVAESSIAYDSDGSYVWRVASDNVIERAGVELGARRNGRVVVRSGLAAGDTVVTSGTHKVYAGSSVEVRTPDLAALAD